MADQMNDAFDGTKSKEKTDGATAQQPVDKQKGGKKKKDGKMLAITAGGSNNLGKLISYTFVLFVYLSRPDLGGASASRLRSGCLQAEPILGRPTQSQERRAQAQSANDHGRRKAGNW